MALRVTLRAGLEYPALGVSGVCFNFEYMFVRVPFRLHRFVSSSSFLFPLVSYFYTLRPVSLFLSCQFFMVLLNLLYFKNILDLPQNLIMVLP